MKIHALVLVLAVGSAPVLVGCAGTLLRRYSAEEITVEQPELEVELVGDVTHPYGMNYLQVEDVGLVVGLKGTGGDPPPSEQRTRLVAEMTRRGVENPEKVLASGDAAMVLVRAFLRPGVQKGDRVDVEVKVPSKGAGTSLRGGNLLPARLSELAAVGHQIHSGHVMGYAQGPVLVDPSATAEEDEALATQGRILSGGVVLKERPLGLGMDERYKSFRLSQQVGTAINRRFHAVHKGQKQGVAKPQTDNFIQLLVHPRYRDNIARYMQVVRSIAIEESPTELIERTKLLARQLADPLTAQTAALRLEAIGSKEAIAALQQALQSDHPEVRFYAAEALAYLDRTEAVEPLASIIRDQPRLRVQSLAALAAMNDRKAYEVLCELLNAQSAETRYGAFRALWAMDPTDPIVRGESLNGQFTLHVLRSSGPPMVHVTGSLRPEIVLFGGSQRLALPATFDAGQHILVNGSNGRDITVSRFAPGMPAQQRVVQPDLVEVIRAVVELGGTYPDIVQMLQEARDAGSLTGWFRVDAVPSVERAAEEDRGTVGL